MEIIGNDFGHDVVKWRKWWDQNKETFRKVKHVDIVFPDNLGCMIKGRVINYETIQPGLGISIGYNAPNVWATIYFYNPGHRNIYDGPESDAISQHFKQVIRDITKKYESVVKLSEVKTPLGWSPGSLEALSASFAFNQRGIEHISYVYLTGYNNNCLKIRITYPKTVRTNAKKTQKLFLNEVGKLLSKYEIP